MILDEADHGDAVATCRGLDELPGPVDLGVGDDDMRLQATQFRREKLTTLGVDSAKREGVGTPLRPQVLAQSGVTEEGENAHGGAQEASGSKGWAVRSRPGAGFLTTPAEPSGVCRFDAWVGARRPRPGVLGRPYGAETGRGRASRHPA